jgi:hypothetical protein
MAEASYLTQQQTRTFLAGLSDLGRVAGWVRGDMVGMERPACTESRWCGMRRYQVGWDEGPTWRLVALGPARLSGLG